MDEQYDQHDDPRRDQRPGINDPLAQDPAPVANPLGQRSFGEDDQADRRQHSRYDDSTSDDSTPDDSTPDDSPGGGFDPVDSQSRHPQNREHHHPEFDSDDRSEYDPESDSDSSRQNSGSGQSGVSGFISRAYWMLIFAAMLFIVWKVGPQIAEEYQFALTRGRMRAEHANAFDQLEDEPLSNVSTAYQLVAQKVRPSVVSISTIRVSDGTRGQGSGVIMSRDGYILTNSHVVKDANQIRVSLYDRHRYRAEVIGTDEDSDLAVIKIDATNLIPADWGNSDQLQVGSIVWAIGNPYGLDQTVTSGIISGVNRLDEEHANRELLQTDAAVNPGNSGGPLVDPKGKVIGINTSIFGDTFQGISFAVPSTVARFVYEELRNSGAVTRGFLGVRPRPVFQDLANRLQLPDLDGAVIDVQSGTPAYSSGLRDADVIRQWNGVPVSVHTNLYRLVEMTAPNETVPVELLRDGIPMMIDVTVGDRRDFVR